MHFLSKKMKSMLQSKQSDQFDALRQTHVVVVVSGFRCGRFLPNSFFLFPLSLGKRLKTRRKVSMAFGKSESECKHRLFSLIKGQSKLFKGQWKVREFLTFWWVATLNKHRWRYFPDIVKVCFSVVVVWFLNPFHSGDMKCLPSTRWNWKSVDWLHSVRKISEHWLSLKSNIFLHLLNGSVVLPTLYCGF